MLASHCLSNPPKVSSSCGAGRVEELGGLQTYVTGARDSHRAILLIADAFGFEAPNLRKLADKVADAGFLVVVPDFYFGDPFNLEKTDFERAAWLKAHTAVKGYEDAKAVIAALKSKGVSAVGAAGFCWGGSPVVKLANNSDWIQAGVALHPGPLEKDDINEVRVPIALLGAESDHIFSAEDLKHLGSMLAQKSEISAVVTTGFITTEPFTCFFLAGKRCIRITPGGVFTQAYISPTCPWIFSLAGEESLISVPLALGYFL